MAQLLKQQGSLASLMPQYITQLTLQQQSFVKELCYGCCRWSPVIKTVFDKRCLLYTYDAAVYKYLLFLLDTVYTHE
mgnify:CR=1 FL=1